VVSSGSILFRQIALIIVSIIIAGDTTMKLAEKQGLPAFNQALSWIVFCKELLLFVLLLCVLS